MTKPVVARTRAELIDAQRRFAGPVGLVMTMGALHDGHAALLRAARSASPTVVATIFVNPLQFAPGEDFDRYPRAFHADIARCAEEKVDIVFAPRPEEVYRSEQLVRIDPGPLADELEGAARPGHFAGVLTVVAKMLHIVDRVDTTYFGEKDYQQLTLVRRMAADLDLPVSVVGVPTVRAADGLALSTRNDYLTSAERRSAVALSAALQAGAIASAAGASGPGVVGAARAVLDAEPAVAVDYLELRAPDLGPAPATGAARLLVAGRVGRTRLIDNMPVELGEAGR